MTFYNLTQNKQTIALYESFEYNNSDLSSITWAIFHRSNYPPWYFITRVVYFQVGNSGGPLVNLVSNILQTLHNWLEFLMFMASNNL